VADQVGISFLAFRLIRPPSLRAKRSEAKQSRTAPQRWIASSLRSSQ
jgi:hypothetical protein